MGGVENLEALRAERAPQHLRGEARAAHPEEDDVREAGRLRGERDELGQTLLHAQRLVEPAEPLRLVATGPEGRVACPEALDQLGALDRRHALRGSTSSPDLARMPSSSSAKESANFSTPSRSSVRVTSS